MSNPIVPFRETIVEPPKVDMVNEIIETQTIQHHQNHNKDEETQANGLIIQKTSNKKSIIKIRAKALPAEVVNLLENSQTLLKNLKDYESYFEGGKLSLLSDTLVSDIEKFKESLAKAFSESKWDPSIVQNIWSFGPKRSGTNLLVNNIPNYSKGCVWPNSQLNQEGDAGYRDSFSSNFVNGFQMATSAGPLCEEPMVGLCFVVEDWTIDVEDNVESTNQPFGPFSGQIMSAVKEGCRKAFQCQPQRLMVAMYSCTIQVNSEVLGKIILTPFWNHSLACHRINC